MEDESFVLVTYIGPADSWQDPNRTSDAPHWEAHWECPECGWCMTQQFRDFPTEAELAAIEENPPCAECEDN